MENNLQEMNEQNEPFYYDEVVDVINQKEERVVEGKIISIRGNIIVVRYSDTKDEENIHKEDNLILKQWRPGRPFRRFNRVDVKNTIIDKWYEGIIIEIKSDKVLIRYNTINPIEEWFNKDSKNIRSVSRFHTSEEINEYLYRKKKFFKSNQQMENKFREEIKTISLKIREIQGDGNCLYRAVSDQIYGTENFFDIVKMKCMDYLDLEKDFFSQFVEGGKDKFDEYLSMKRTDGVWGDDLELQAMSEIYNRPIEIFSHSKEPLKTFHETKEGFTRIHLNERNQEYNSYPIRLSYHGMAHYNSLLPIDDYNTFKNNLLSSRQPGEYENSVLEKVKGKNLIEKENAIINVNINFDDFNNEKIKLEISRTNLIEKMNKDLDFILEEKMINNFDNPVNINNSINNKANIYNEVIKQSEFSATEESLLNSIIELSIKEAPHHQYDNDVETQTINNPSINFILEMGFTLEEAILAYSAVGENPDHMLQYLYSLNIN